MRPLLIVGSCLAIELVASTAHAQCGSGAISLMLDPSVRSAGLGGATTAFFRGDDPNYWANPALLGYSRGLRYESSDTQLVPDLTDDIFFRSDRWSLGAWGVGLALNTWPGEQSPIYLDYGESTATDEFGNPIGTFRSYEAVESWGIGVNVLELVEKIQGANPGARSRYFDVSLGYSRKHVLVNLAPANILTDPTQGGGGAIAEANADDIGFLVRATPYNTIDHPAGSTPVGLRLDAGVGLSILNFIDKELVFGSAEQSDPIARDTRWGVFLGGAIGLPDGARRSVDDSWPAWAGWLVSSISPLVEVGASWDFSTISVPKQGGGHRDCRDVQSWGLELTFLQFFTVRRGSIDDDRGDIHGSTTGWGAGFRLGDFGGFRIDQATVPQATGLVDIDRDGFMAWIDVVAIAREFGGQ